MNVRRFNVALVAFLLVSVAGVVSWATGLRDYLDGEQTLSIADRRVMADLAKYYRLHGNVRLGPEQRLTNGVAWRLLTDIRTGVKSPRITWMPDRESMLKANALFDVVQGAALVDYDKLDLERRTTELYDWSFGEPPSFVIKPPYFFSEKVAVTYATSKFVSYVELRREVRANSMGVEVYGRVLDLEQGRIREIEGCDPPRYAYSKAFRFGELLDVCEDEAYERFIALWAGKVRDAIAAARLRGDELSVQCGESMEPLDWSGGRRLGLSLTPSGVAVFNEYSWSPHSAKFCAFYDDITVNPIVLSYRELEPFMKPGPWRDEVLNQGHAASPRGANSR